MTNSYPTKLESRLQYPGALINAPCILESITNRARESWKLIPSFFSSSYLRKLLQKRTPAVPHPPSLLLRSTAKILSKTECVTHAVLLNLSHAAALIINIGTRSFYCGGCCKCSLLCNGRFTYGNRCVFSHLQQLNSRLSVIVIYGCSLMKCSSKI